MLSHTTQSQDPRRILNCRSDCNATLYLVSTQCAHVCHDAMVCVDSVGRGRGVGYSKMLQEIFWPWRFYATFSSTECKN